MELFLHNETKKYQFVSDKFSTKINGAKNLEVLSEINKFAAS
jgi:hypothetical protein